MSVVCEVCFHHCLLEDEQIGRCRARKALEGKSFSVNYGKITSIALDPIEKKPLQKFFPGSTILSLGSFGCNLSCPFCQNHSISMIGEEEAEYQLILPDDAVKLALREKERGNIGIAFTYNEPLIGYEYVRDTARLIRNEGMKNVVVTNGCVTQSTALAVLPYIDALNIDLKTFRDSSYKKLGGDLETVKKFIQTAHEYAHIELTTLIVPGLNDSVDEIEELSSWVASIDPEIVLHVSRFFPAWKMDQVRPTQVELVYELAKAARNHLKYVYTGNC